MERCDAGLPFWIVGRGAHENANAPHAPGLLRARCERPHGRTAEQREDIATVHSITSSASASSVGGTVRPSAVAAFALKTNSNFVGCCTGRSAGLAPFRMRTT